ncbi:hypothetical protein [Sorangium sp. So ce1389]|uniref:hypothetical protein n=1 Tax=Sorangium sp. So ce1389 TaxID=3133336 RepID=UPI003F600CD5
MSWSADPGRDRLAEARRAPARPAGGPWARAGLSATAAAVAYGSWAVFCNRAHGAAAALKAGLTQGTVSLVLTLVMMLILEWLFRLGRTPARGFLLASSGTTALVVVITTTVHTMAGTPRLFSTIAPSCLVGAAFFTTQAFRLSAAARRECAASALR